MRRAWKKSLLASPSANNFTLPAYSMSGSTRPGWSGSLFAAILLRAISPVYWPLLDEGIAIWRLARSDASAGEERLERLTGELGDGLSLGGGDRSRPVAQLCGDPKGDLGRAGRLTRE